MADPQHVPELDRFDEMTVRLYRMGLSLAAFSLVVIGILHILLGMEILTSSNPWPTRMWLLGRHFHLK